MTPRHRRPLLAVTAIIGLTLAPTPPARAAYTVIDPWNLVQNVLQVAREVEQIANQVTSLANEAQMLANQARNLASLDYSSLAQINGAIARIGGLLVRVEDIAYDITAIEDAFARTYPESYPAGTDAARLFADAQARFEQVMGAARHAMAVQATVVGGIDADRNELATLVTRSQAAVGALQAAQAGNQLLALQVKQLTDLQAMLAADGRARAREAARAAAAQEQAREQRRRFIETTTLYTPVTVRMFHP